MNLFLYIAVLYVRTTFFVYVVTAPQLVKYCFKVYYIAIYRAQYSYSLYSNLYFIIVIHLFCLYIHVYLILT